MSKSATVKVDSVLHFSAGVTFGVVAMLVIQRVRQKQRQKKHSCGLNEQVAALQSLPHEIDRDVNELAKSVRSGVLSGSEASMVVAIKQDWANHSIPMALQTLWKTVAREETAHKDP